MTAFDLKELKNNDFSNERTLTLDDQVITLKREPELGFVYVIFSKGRVPDRLKGRYTSFFEAEKDVLKYVNNKGLKQAI